MAAAGTSCTDDGGKVCDGKGVCKACLTTADCTASTTVCATVACSAHVCVATPAAEGKPCQDSGGAVCDGAGKCVDNHCTNGVKDADETDVDCGGASCKPCADHRSCLAGSDCANEVCDPTAKTCTPATCTDGVQNGNETDVDCGGGTCPRCRNGKQCKAVGDCFSDICTSMVCIGVGEGQPCGSDLACMYGYCPFGRCCSGSGCYP
jgi:hypothetical protein